MKILAIVVIVLLFFPGCGNDGAFEIKKTKVLTKNLIPVTTTPPYRQPRPLRVRGKVSSTYRGNNSKVDILLSIDNSGSMETYITQVAQNIESFLLGLVQENVDYQLGIVRNTDYGLGQFDSVLYGDPSVVKWSDKDAVKKIISNIESLARVPGGSDERAVQSVELILANSDNWIVPGGGERRLFREDSKFVFVLLTDADEFYNTGSTTLLQNHFELINRLSNERTWQMTSIGTPMSNPCPAENTSQWLLEELTIMSGGIMGRICEDYSVLLLQIMDRVVKVARSVSIASKIPYGFNVDDKTISVFVNGHRVPRDHLYGWVYDPQAKLVVFSKNYPFKQGDQIEVHFDAVRI